jgi:hypothetical protein
MCFINTFLCVILSNCTFSGWNDFPLENLRMVRQCIRSFQQVEPSVLFMTAIQFRHDIYANINNFPGVLMCPNFVMVECCSILWYLSMHSVVMPVQQSGRRSFFWICGHCTSIFYKQKETFDINFSLFSKIRYFKGNPFTDLDRPWGFQEVEAPRFQDNLHMNGKVSLTHRPPLPPGNIPRTHFC